MSQVDEKHLNTHRSLKLKVKVRFLAYHRIETPQIRLCFIICYSPIGTIHLSIFFLLSKEIMGAAA